MATLIASTSSAANATFSVAQAGHRCPPSQHRESRSLRRTLCCRARERDSEAVPRRADAWVIAASMAGGVTAGPALGAAIQPAGTRSVPPLLAAALCLALAHHLRGRAPLGTGG
ncbi:hypothetical protein ACFTY8_46165 [Streptomyces mirabilis]|uniref:hypothetical protein n=1 Tax=Streptomyces mirabilis TaxID=68239 RepID=UPI003629A98A